MVMMMMHRCNPGEPHYFAGGTHCCCGAVEAPIIMQASQHRQFQAALVAETARADAADVENAAFRAMLRRVEWEGVWYVQGEGVPACIDCLTPQSDGHDPDCQLGAILAADPPSRGAEIMEAANAMAEAIAGLICPTVTWPTGSAALERYRALAGQRSEGGEEMGR